MSIITTITNGGNYTKIITLFHQYLEKYEFPDAIDKKLKELYQEVLSYDDKVFPIHGYSITNPKSVGEIIYSLPIRRKIIDIIATLPSVAKRNLRDDIRQVRTWQYFDDYLDRLQYFMGYYSLIDNKPDSIRQKIIKKIFKTGCSLISCVDFIEEKSNLLGGTPFTKKSLVDIRKEYDIDLLCETNDYSILQVNDVYGIQAVGCNSLWCFTYGYNNWKQWAEYSHNDMVYVIVDWRKQDNSTKFMHVVINPLVENGKLVKFKDDFNYTLYDMANENCYNPISVLKSIFGKKYVSIIKKHLTFNY